MEISDVRIRRTCRDERLRAIVSVTIDGVFAVHDIKIIEGPDRVFVAMPSRRDERGAFRDVCHPITPEARRYFEERILSAYEAHLRGQESAVQPQITAAPPLS